MPALSIPKNYNDGEILFESDLDDIRNALETFMNITKLDADNIQLLAITTALLANDAVTPAKLDDTGDFVMDTLVLNNAANALDISSATGTITIDDVTLSRGAANRLLVASTLQLGDTNGPILSKSDTNELLINSKFQIEDTNGPTLVKAGDNMLGVRSEIEMQSNAGATGPRLIRKDSDVLGINNNSGTFIGNAIITANTVSTDGYKIQAGLAAIGGSTTAAVVFAEAYLAGTTPVVNATPNSSGVGAAWQVNAVTDTGFTITNFAGSSVTFGWQSYGRYS